MPDFDYTIPKCGDFGTAALLAVLAGNHNNLRASLLAEHLASGAHNTPHCPRVAALITWDGANYSVAAGYGVASVSGGSGIVTLTFSSAFASADNYWDEFCPYPSANEHAGTGDQYVWWANGQAPQPADTRDIQIMRACMPSGNAHTVLEFVDCSFFYVAYTVDNLTTASTLSTLPTPPQDSLITLEHLAEMHSLPAALKTAMDAEHYFLQGRHDTGLIPRAAAHIDEGVTKSDNRIELVINPSWSSGVSRIEQLPDGIGQWRIWWDAGLFRDTNYGMIVKPADSGQYYNLGNMMFAHLFNYSARFVDVQTVTCTGNGITGGYEKKDLPFSVRAWRLT